MCLSLLELRDAKSDLLVPEGGQEALHAIADPFGYDVLGFPATKARSSRNIAKGVWVL